MDDKQAVILILFLGICLGAGGIGSILTSQGVHDWYPRLRKPAGTPPGWVFAPVWTMLYVLMAVAAWLVWREYGWLGANSALALFFGQLALNIAWPGIFFASRMPAVAFAEIVLLWMAVAFNIVVFHWLYPTSALLLVPYFLWVTYAGYLNFGIWRLNRVSGGVS